MPCNGGPWGNSGDSYHADWKECEKALCEARWVVLELAKVGKIPARLRELIARVKDDQLKHRHEDRDSYIETLRSLIRDCDDNEQRIREAGGIPGKRLEAKRQKYRDELKRVKAMSDSDLLDNYWGSERRLHEGDE